MFEGILYPAEIADVMVSVLRGDWDGPHPEKYIDALLHDFVNRIGDKKAWADGLALATKRLGCRDIVYARLNLEALLEQSEPQTVVVMYDRQRLLPGEKHGAYCNCRACIFDALEKQRLQQEQAAGLHKQITDKNAGKSAGDDNDPYATSRMMTEYAPDGDPLIVYPEGAELDQLQETFYAGKREIKRDPPAPSLSPERKQQVLDWLRNTNYHMAESRDAAWARLEKMLKSRPPEHNIIARIVYLIVFEAIRSVDRQYLLDVLDAGAIGTRRALPYNG